MRDETKIRRVIPQHSVAHEGSGPSLLLTVLGELVVPAGDPVWTATLLYALAGLGVNRHTARQTIARAADAGWISGEKHGREVRWSVTPTAVEIIDDITGRVRSLNAPAETWDGNCLIINVTITHDKRTARKRLYSALSWAGFGNPAPGLWATPHVERLDEISEVIDQLGLRESTIAVVGTPAGRLGLSSQEIVERAWNLDDVAARYERLLDTFGGQRPEPGDDLLFTHLALVDEWRKFPTMDPQLPQDLLPNWIGRQAADTFVELHSTWQPAARERWREVVELTAPDGG
ncbi:MAG TPA: PaaX family transcriptional regulator C-terminal domain-containing protein [Pseudonocardia sp.]